MNKNKETGLTFLKNEITNSYLFARFLNKLTKNGKKALIEKLIYSLFLEMKLHRINCFLEIFYVLELLRPVAGVRPLTSRGKTQFIPAVITVERQYAYATS